MNALEQKIIDAAMRRLVSWKAEYPQGLLPADHPQGIPEGAARELIVACLAYEKSKESP